jgi:hypothetical protein
VESALHSLEGAEPEVDEAIVLSGGKRWGKSSEPSGSAVLYRKGMASAAAGNPLGFKGGM